MVHGRCIDSAAIYPSPRVRCGAHTEGRLTSSRSLPVLALRRYIPELHLVFRNPAACCHPPAPPQGPPALPSLKMLAQRLLGRRIQEGAHDSHTDATCTLEAVQVMGCGSYAGSGCFGGGVCSTCTAPAG